MGNIISNTSGVAASVNGSIGEGNAFQQNITDILLELNLYNTGNYNQNTDTTNFVTDNPIGPRDEFNFLDGLSTTNKVALTSTGITSIDTINKSRPMIESNYVDIIGLPYVTDEQNDTVWTAAQKSSSLGNDITNPSHAKSIASNNKYYNIKRAICNSSTVAPVDMVGVDIPVDSPDMVNFSSSSIKTNQLLNYPQGTTNMSTIVDNCLTWGTITTPTQGTCILDSKGACTPESIPKIPDISIYKSASNPNSPTQNLKLNDYSNQTKTGSYSPHTIYDTEIKDPQCISILNNLIMNSYATVDIMKYSKWSPAIKAAGINTDNISNYAFIHDPISGNIDLNRFDVKTGSLTNISNQQQPSHPATA